MSSQELPLYLKLALELIPYHMEGAKLYLGYTFRSNRVSGFHSIVALIFVNQAKKKAAWQK